METSAPAKIILFGEHAVVYGQPAIAIPVTSLRVRVNVEVQPVGAGLILYLPTVRGEGIHIPTLTAADDEISLAFAVRSALTHWGLIAPPDLALTLYSDIPQGRGLGSGAAVSAALIRALATALGREISNDTLNGLVYEVEKKHHGTPSGIDNTVIVYEQPVYFVRGEPIQPLQIKTPFTLLIGDTGYGTPTHVPVGDVRRLMETRPEKYQPIIAQIGEIAHTARDAIESGNIGILGELMNENHGLLQRLTVSSVELDVLCETALEAGAWGAKMSGGGRGGNMLALVEDSQAETVMKALTSAGAARVVKTRVRG